MKLFIAGGIVFLACLIGVIGSAVLAWHNIHPLECIIFGWIAAGGLATMPRIMFSGIQHTHCRAPHFFPGVIACGVAPRVGSAHHDLVTRKKHA